MHPRDAAARGLEAGQIVRLHNSRGAYRARLTISETIRFGVIQIATGAWYQPDGDTYQHGNPKCIDA